MSTPIVVQGTRVANPQSSYAPQNTYATSGPTDQSSTWNGKGVKQETKCRDPIFAVLFYICVAGIVAVAATKGPDAMDTGGSTENEYEYSGFVTAAVIIACVSFLAAAAGMAVLMAIPAFLIKAALLFSVAMAGAMMVVSFASGQIGMGILGLIFFAMSVCYAYFVWSRIPFATINLITACTAIRANLGVTIFAYIFTIFAGLWTVTWSVAFLGVFDATFEEKVCEDDKVCTDVNYGFLFLLFVALYFVQQVLQSCVHVTVAGTVGHWWFEPSEASSCCSSAVSGAFIRTITTSFGSICFGSLIVAILEALRMLANVARNNDDGNGIMLCIAECILACLASLMEYFNKWAFIYVGLYGYNYMEAGRNVFTLFKNRGWEAIIADDLVGNALTLVSIVTGLITGVFGLVLALSSDLFEDAGGNEKIMAFLLGFFIGLVITSILMSTISSGVNAVIVLFAEAPAEFQRNHPDLSTRMTQIWSEVFPGSV